MKITYINPAFGINPANINSVFAAIVAATEKLANPDGIYAVIGERIIVAKPGNTVHDLAVQYETRVANDAVAKFAGIIELAMLLLHDEAEDSARMNSKFICAIGRRESLDHPAKLPNFQSVLGYELDLIYLEHPASRAIERAETIAA